MPTTIVEFLLASGGRGGARIADADSEQLPSNDLQSAPSSAKRERKTWVQTNSRLASSGVKLGGGDPYFPHAMLAEYVVHAELNRAGPRTRAMLPMDAIGES